MKTLNLKKLNIGKKLGIMLMVALFSLGLTALANTAFNIDDAFFSSTNIDSGNYSALHFGYNGNNFDGIVFWGGELNTTGQLTMGATTINCDKQLKGLYINTARGNKIWPLDQETLAELRASSSFSGYNALGMTGGFWTKCSGAGIDSDDIYGYIEHGYNGIVHKLWAGVNYNFGNGTALASFSGTLKYITGSSITASGYIFDDQGGIANTYTSQTLNINMLWTGTNISSTGTTTHTGVQVSIYSNQNATFQLSGDIITPINGNIIGGTYTDKNILLTNGIGAKNIILSVSTGGTTKTSNITITLVSPTVNDTTAPTVNLTSPANSFSQTGSSLTLSWQGFDNVAIDHYSLYINGSTQASWNNLSAGTTSQNLSSLNTGNYTWYVIATDTSGNTGISLTRNFTINQSAVVDNVNPVVSLTYPTNNATFTTNAINFQWQGSDNVAIDHYSLYINGTHQYSRSTIVGNNQIVSPMVNGVYTWYVVVTDTSGNTGQSLTHTVTLSGTTVVPTLVTPSVGANITLGNLTLTRTGASSASGYTWQISSNNSFTSIVANGDTNNTSISPSHNTNFMTGSFYWRVINKTTNGASVSRQVNIINNTGTDLKVENFDFDNIEDADLSELYKSNKITIAGLSSGVSVSAVLKNSRGTLFVNNVMVGNSGQVKNGDKVYIELFSDNDYDEKTETTLVIGLGSNSISDKFKIYTKEDDDSDYNIKLSYTQKLQAIMLVDSLIDMYGNNEDKLIKFLTTFQAVLKDKSDMLSKDMKELSSTLLLGQKASIDYLYEVIDDYLDDMSTDSSDIYIAPNGKQYIVTYNTERFAYTSPDFSYEKYFPTWGRFTAHIDMNNPGSYHGSYRGGNLTINKQGEKIDAPNGKTYYVYQANGKWTSQQFYYTKYFDSRDQIIEYIFVNNAGHTRDHEVDTSFDSVKVTTNNGKTYTIFKTSDTKGNNRNKYSSFKFVTAKYFSTLQAAKNHIISMNK